MTLSDFNNWLAGNPYPLPPSWQYALRNQQIRSNLTKVFWDTYTQVIKRKSDNRYLTYQNGVYSFSPLNSATVVKFPNSSANILDGLSNGTNP